MKILGALLLAVTLSAGAAFAQGKKAYPLQVQMGDICGAHLGGDVVLVVGVRNHKRGYRPLLRCEVRSKALQPCACGRNLRRATGRRRPLRIRRNVGRKR